MTRPILEYAGTIYAPIISDNQLTALQVTQNQGLRIATGCTSDTNINHIHDETKILPIEKHLRLHSSQLRQKASHPDHPLHRLTTQPQPPRLKKKTIFNNNQYTLNIDPDPTHAIDENTIKRNMKTIHTTIVQDHLSNRPINKLLNRPPPDIDKKEETLPHSTRRKLYQLSTNKSPLLMTYLHKIDPANHPAANCPLCNDPNHDSLHLFNCPDIPTTLTVWDLWTDPVGVAALLDVWGEKLGGPRAGVWDPVRAHARDGVDTTTNIRSNIVQNFSGTCWRDFQERFRSEVEPSRPDHLPTLSTAKASELSPLVKSPFWWRSGRCRLCCSDFCFSVPAISRWTLDRSRHQYPLTVYDWCKWTRMESAEKSLNCRLSLTVKSKHCRYPRNQADQQD